MQRAVRQVRFVKGKGFGGAFWYVGNEDQVVTGTATTGNAGRWKAHVRAMKAEDPTIKVFFNCAHRRSRTTGCH